MLASGVFLHFYNYRNADRRLHSSFFTYSLILHKLVKSSILLNVTGLLGIRLTESMGLLLTVGQRVETTLRGKVTSLLVYRPTLSHLHIKLHA